VFHRKRAKALAPVWQKELRAAPGKRKLSFLYLANDVLQNSRKKGPEWIEALWPKMEWATKHTIKATSDEKTQKSCAKLVKVWLERRIFGSRSLEGWLDASGGDDAGDAAADKRAAPPAQPIVARRKEERLTSIADAALTGKNAQLAKALEAAEKAIGVLAAADKTCAADLTPEVLADGFVDQAKDPEDAKRKVQAAESALAARREALEECSRLRVEAVRLAQEVSETYEAAAEEESRYLEESAAVAVKVASLRMKATKRAAAAMAVAAAQEAAGANKSKPGLEPPSSGTAAASNAPAVPIEEEYVPEGQEEYVPEDTAAAPDLEQLLAAGATNPEVLQQALAALPEEARAAFEQQLKEAGML
tara:strand:- start:8646 stop:9734 length:1089 start_codon:yes stop_codon:yes gene_type:complete